MYEIEKKVEEQIPIFGYLPIQEVKNKSKVFDVITIKVNFITLSHLKISCDFCFTFK